MKTPQQIKRENTTQTNKQTNKQKHQQKGKMVA